MSIGQDEKDRASNVSISVARPLADTPGRRPAVGYLPAKDCLSAIVGGGIGGVLVHGTGLLSGSTSISLPAVCSMFTEGAALVQGSEPLVLF